MRVATLSGRSAGEETTPSGMTLQYPRANLAGKTVLSGQTKAKSITNLFDNCSWDREPLLPKDVTSSWHTKYVSTLVLEGGSLVPSCGDVTVLTNMEVVNHRMCRG